jgi:hypothetical protein
MNCPLGLLSGFYSIIASKGSFAERKRGHAELIGSAVCDSQFTPSKAVLRLVPDHLFKMRQSRLHQILLLGFELRLG